VSEVIDFIEFFIPSSAPAGGGLVFAFQVIKFFWPPN